MPSTSLTLRSRAGRSVCDSLWPSGPSTKSQEPSLLGTALPWSFPARNSSRDCKTPLSLRLQTLPGGRRVPGRGRPLAAYRWDFENPPLRCRSVTVLQVPCTRGSDGSVRRRRLCPCLRARPETPPRSASQPQALQRCQRESSLSTKASSLAGRPSGSAAMKDWPNQTTITSKER